MCQYRHCDVNVHASQQEGCKSCAHKQDLAMAKFCAGRKSEYEWIIYSMPLPCVHIDGVHVKMDCYQDERTAQ